MAEGPVVLVRFGAALLAIAGTVLVLSIAFVGIGISARRAFGLRGVSLDDCLLSFWVGYSLTLLLLICWNFAFPVGLAALLTVLAAGGLGVIHAWSELVAAVEGRPWKPRTWEWLVLAAGSLWVVIHAVPAFASWDGVLYHVQAVKWASAFAVVPGIANLHGPLAFNNSSFLYDAMVDSGWWEGRGYHVANAVLLHGAVMQALINGLQWCRGRLPANHRLFSFLMLPLALHMARDAASYSTDLPMALVLGAAVALLYSMLDEADQPSRTEDSYAVFALATLLAAAVSIKLTAAVFATVSLLIGVIVLLRKEPRAVARLGRSLTWTALILIVFGGAWVARGVVMSGYPFFPIAIAGFPVDWRAPVEHANVEAAYIQFTEREFTWRMIGSSWVRLILLRDVNAALVPGAIAVSAGVLVWRSKRHRSWGAAVDKTFWLAAPIAIAILVWLVTAPSHRYSPPLFWSLAALCVTGCVRATWPDFVGRRRQFGYAALTAIALSPLYIDPIVLAIRQGRNPLPMLARHNLGGPGMAWGLPPLGGTVDVTPFTTRSADTLNVPARLTGQRAMPNACWGAPLPCTPNPAPNLEVRVPADLRYGFRVNGAWEMQNWPYYWQSFFLPEWRRRHGQTTAEAR
jgi:hypothetical protein